MPIAATTWVGYRSSASPQVKRPTIAPSDQVESMKDMIVPLMPLSWSSNLSWVSERTIGRLHRNTAVASSQNTGMRAIAI